MICLNCRRENIVYKTDGLCRKCYLKKYYIAHKEKWNYYAEKNREERRIRDKEYREEHREDIRLKRKLKSEEHKKWMKEYHKRNKEQGRQYRKQNVSRIKENTNQWRKTLAGLACMRQQHFKRRTGLNSKDVNRVIQENLLKYGAFCCEKCKQLTGNDFHLDHIIPIAKGGNNNYENLQLLCPDCNIQKRTQVADYRESGFLAINF